MAINFFTEEVKEVRIPKRKVKTWVNQCITLHNKITKDINYIFCSDEYLRRINIKFLNHDYYTDIITFNNNENNKISGDIYISLERVRENATMYKVNFHDELQRVIIHGILHLVGLDDKTDEQKEEMRNAENTSISLYKKIWKEF